MNREERAPAGTVSEGTPEEGPRLFTLGYEGRDLREVLEIVQRHAIEQVLDVRENASSKKAGFAKDDLKEALAGIGVAYAHLSELGCARESRHALWRGGEERLFREEYRRRLAERPEAFDDLVHQVRSARTLVLCLERDPARCHRAVLTERLRAEGIDILDL